MREFGRYARLFVVLGTLLAARSVQAAGAEFDFKDPKGVNSISFTLDSLLEPFTGVASGISGKVTFDPADPKATKGTITVETKSLHIENKGMKETLHGPDWLDVAKNPKIDFAIKKVTDYKSAGDNVFDLTVVGDLTCKGVTKELTVPVKATYLPGKLGERSSKLTGDLLVLRANFAMKRKDFGIKPDVPDKAVAEEIQLRVSIAGVSPKK
ncbi:MAG: YceI family protein [Planctomycetota bacterium]